MMNKDFVAIILTHGRAGRVVTYNTLKKCGYTGDIIILIDNEDTQAEAYKKEFGEQVEIFDKLEASKRFDEGDNFNDRRAIFYARNVCFDVARARGYKYFIELDDDYTTFVWKFNMESIYHERRILNLDKVFEKVLRYFKETPRIQTICFAQNGDFIGGGKGTFGKEIKLHRKAMNTFMCDVERRFDFVGRVNEDVNTYTSEGRKGVLFVTIPMVAIKQEQTQRNRGGMSEMYIDNGTYVKSYYSILYCPSAVKIATMGDKHKRIHHKVKWNNCAPKIV